MYHHSHFQIVGGLLMVMDDYPHPRVQAHAGAALVNFSEDCPKNILVMYLDPIIAKLDQLLQNRFKEVSVTKFSLLEDSYR